MLLNPVIQNDIAEVIKAKEVLRFSGKRLLITGGTGMVGSYILAVLAGASDFLRQSGDMPIKIVAIVRDADKAKKILGTLAKHEDIVFAVSDFSKPLDDMGDFDYIIHAASPASPGNYLADPLGAISTNISGVINILDYADKYMKNKFRFLFISSGEVYGIPNKNVVTENDYGFIDPLNPRSCYAESKRLAENILINHRWREDTDCVMARLCHTYSCTFRDNDDRVFADFVRCALNKKIIEIRNPSAVRPFCYVTDALNAFFTLISRGKSNEAYNVGNPQQACTMLQLGEIISEISGSELKISSTSWKDSPIQICLPSVDKLKNLGWSPSVSIKEGFTKTYRGYEYVSNITKRV